MHSELLFATTQLKIDPGLNEVFGFFFAVIILAFIGLAIWYLAPILRSTQQHKRLAKLEAANAIKFDPIESELHCGHHSKRIEPYSLQYYVIMLTFSAPTKYSTDYDVMDEKEHKGDGSRAVYQAVRLVNEKAKRLGLKNDLLKRGKESTSVNDMYRVLIIKLK
jgi:hypothetical protein